MAVINPDQDLRTTVEVTDTLAQGWTCRRKRSIWILDRFWLYPGNGFLNRQGAMEAESNRGVASTGDSATSHTMSVPSALALATRLHRSGEMAVAERIYGRILEAVPDNPDATHFLGVLHHGTGRSEEGLRLIRRAIGLQPDDAGMRNNLGNILNDCGRFEEAVEAYLGAVEIEPRNVDILNNLGVALRTLNRFNDSEVAYRRVIAIDPTYREAHDNLGRLLASRGRFEEAVACHQTALKLEPRNAETRRLLADMHVLRGDRAKAVAIIDDWLKDEPGSVTAHHLRAAISGDDVPTRASDAYVAKLFDAYAPSFDRSLSGLEYRAPDLVATVLEAMAGRPDKGLAILDAGCGTGLCGPLVAEWARSLVGVDLSEGMLAQAAERGCYDTLVHAELTQFLLAHENAYDFVLSADTLCYFGDLAAVLAAARGALTAGGGLIFTLEADAGPRPFVLNPHGRYAHQEDYVRQMLDAAGFTQIGIDHQTLRMQRGDPVQGLVVNARRS
ncbi:tetratricopeptide repeat protein [Methylobacterium goesingense]|uniref:TPR repeat methyltransferase n=1 Tax=Methylobacterium goesingense TaxID=243690 RepID=A0ABV2L8U2_9HYPH|nr:tetratricopeptide repeat protein [Methylobacterium goesingense]